METQRSTKTHNTCNGLDRARSLEYGIEKVTLLDKNPQIFILYGLLVVPLRPGKFLTQFQGFPKRPPIYSEHPQVNMIHHPLHGDHTRLEGNFLHALPFVLLLQLRYQLLPVL